MLSSLKSTLAGVFRRPPRERTAADHAALDRAQAKRERKANKRRVHLLRTWAFYHPAARHAKAWNQVRNLDIESRAA